MRDTQSTEKDIKTYGWLGIASAFMVIFIFPGFQTPEAAPPEIVKFSAATAGGKMPAGWKERNVYEDYKTASSQEPPMIGAVMIMTDPDNTGESAISYFGDIVFKQK